MMTFFYLFMKIDFQLPPFAPIGVALLFHLTTLLIKEAKIMGYFCFHGLGSLARLPLEVRLMIWDELVQ